MVERYLRALWFALFASVGLMAGGFVLGYGAGHQAGPSPTPVPATPPLPTLAATPPGTTIATPVDTVGGGGASARAEGTATPTAEAAGSISAQPAPWPGSFPQEQSVGDGLAVSLEKVDVNSALGGVEVVLRLSNNSSREVTFSFAPGSDLSVTDDRGQRYDLRWAEFDGAVTLTPEGSARLVRAFFSGSIDKSTRYLEVEVRHLPQLPEVSWQVPVGR